MSSCEVRFTEEQLIAFKNLSGDVNPLHTDEDYCRRTPFARRVVYGIAGVLYGLGAWASGRRFRLVSIKGDFKKPMFLDETYRLEITESGSKVVISYYKGQVLRQKISFVWADFPLGDGKLAPSLCQPAVAPAEEFNSVRLSEVIARVKNYRPDFRYGDELASLFGISLSQMPPYQLTSLCWASYVVGMEIPGRQALFTNLEFLFDESVSSTFEIKELRVDQNPVFKFLEIEGSAEGIPTVRLICWARPEFVEVSLAKVRAVVGTSDRFSGKTAFVSGGGRGFGAALGAALALHGADVIINYRSGHAEAIALKAQIETLGRKALLAQGDLSHEEGTRKVLSQIKAAGLNIDILVNNAAPPIPTLTLGEQSGADVLDFVRNSLGIVVNSTYGLMPLFSPNMTFVFISSSFVKRSEPKFSAYVTAKSAIEGWVRALATEMPKIRFLTVRPNRMLTDATNALQLTEELASPEEMAGRILALLSVDGRAGNFELSEFGIPNGDVT